MTKEQLSSDRINYLIWRYLQETNYLATAVKLQQEWNIEDPQQLDFAPHVQHHTLVAVLHRGLLYHESERECLPSHPDTGFFGPLPVSPVSPPPRHALADEPAENGTAVARKRTVDAKSPTMVSPLPNGAPQAKRPKLSNGHDHPAPVVVNGVSAATTPMDLDEPADRHAYPSPQEVDAPLPPRVTVGAEHGTQVDKVRELAAETTFLPLSDESVPATMPAASPVLLHCAWSPRDASVLVAAGTEALARVWTMSRSLAAAAAAEPLPHVNGSTPPPPPYRDLRPLAPPPLAPHTSVSAMAWSDDGDAIALAVEPHDDDVARVSIWSVDGRHINSFEGFDPPVISLSWNPSSKLLLGLMPEGERTLINVFPSSAQPSLSYVLPNNLYQQSVDVAWTSDSEFVLCGGEHLLGLRCVDKEIELARKFEVNRELGLLHNVSYDWRTHMLATARDTGLLEIWDIQGKVLHTIPAHAGTVVSLLWQPSHATLASTDERLLATSGVDGLIKLWSVRPGDVTPRIIDMAAPVVAMAFTPDGAFLAGATSDKILIWKVDDVNMPRASWSRGAEPGWLSPKVNGTMQLEDVHCLSWDANGQKLAYGFNSNLAVIDFRR